MNDFTQALRALPAYAAPPGGWPRLQQALATPPQRRRRRVAGLALAASLLLAVGVVVRLPAPPADSAPRGDVARLMQHSQNLERDLARLRPQVVVWNAGYAARAQAIEDHLAVVDLQLNYAQPAGARRLWQDRVALLGSLVETHRAASLAAAPARTPNDPSPEWSL